jgi:hypothetical protein
LNADNGFDTTFENLKEDFAKFKALGYRKSLFKTANNETDISLNVKAVSDAQERVCIG